jgi:hypothetical protein
VLVLGGVIVDFLNDGVKERSKSSVGKMRPSINTNRAIYDLTATEDAIFKATAMVVSLIFQLVPYLPGKVLCQEGSGSSWEFRHAGELIRGEQMVAHFGKAYVLLCSNEMRIPFKIAVLNKDQESDSISKTNGVVLAH